MFSQNKGDVPTHILVVFFLLDHFSKRRSTTMVLWFYKVISKRDSSYCNGRRGLRCFAIWSDLQGVISLVKILIRARFGAALHNLSLIFKTRFVWRLLCDVFFIFNFSLERLLLILGFSYRCLFVSECNPLNGLDNEWLLIKLLYTECIFNACTRIIWSLRNHWMPLLLFIHCIFLLIIDDLHWVYFRCTLESCWTRLINVLLRNWQNWISSYIIRS